MLPHWCKTHSRKAVPHVHVMHQFLLHTERPTRGQEPSAGEWCINDRCRIAWPHRRGGRYRMRSSVASCNPSANESNGVFPASLSV